jgi:hypothetical protein
MNLRRDVFQAIADPTRRSILMLVAAQSMTAGAIASNFDTARYEKNGREIIYHLNPNKMKEIADFIEPFRKMWDEKFNKLETVMKAYQSNSDKRK